MASGGPVATPPPPRPPEQVAQCSAPEQAKPSATTGQSSAPLATSPGAKISPVAAPAAPAAAASGAEPIVPAHEPVVDWKAAVEQCSGDEEFLKELLVDLWTESTDHLKGLQAAVPTRETETVQHIAHSIKGAAANLMCYRLRDAALFLEKSGIAVGHGKLSAEDFGRDADAGLACLEEEMIKFEQFLKERSLIT